MKVFTQHTYTHMYTHTYTHKLSSHVFDLPNPARFLGSSGKLNLLTGILIASETVGVEGEC